MPKTLKPLKDQVEQHIKRQARSSVDACGKLGTVRPCMRHGTLRSTLSSTPPAMCVASVHSLAFAVIAVAACHNRCRCCGMQSSEDAKKYVETLLGVYHKYLRQINLAFEGDALFVQAMDIALKDVVNRNAVTNNGRAAGRSPELLAKYCDSLLKRGSKVEGDQLEERLTQIMTIFNVS